jgi:single-strand DNA-binding protein
MAKSVNKVILLGNLGKDPEIRSFENGTSKASFTLATTDSYQNKATGETVNQTEWHNVVAWRGLADIVGKYMKKGDKVYVEGKLKSRSWNDQDGNTKYITEIEADNIIMMSRNGEQSNVSSPNTPSYISQAQNSDTSTPVSSNSQSAIEEDDDLPF